MERLALDLPGAVKNMVVCTKCLEYVINTEFSKIFPTLSLSYKRLPLVEISPKSSHIWGRKGPETPKRSCFIDAALPRKHLKINNFGITCFTDETYHNYVSP